MNDTTIMIAEDEVVTAEDLKLSLEKMGYTISATATSGEEILRKVETVSPDIIIMDIKLSGKLDGIETAKLLHRRYDMPVIFLSAYGDDYFVKRAKKTRPYCYLIKPFNEQELRLNIEMALYSAQLERRLVASEEKYRLLVESTSEAVVSYTQTGAIAFWNKGAQKLFGYGPEEVKGKHRSMLYYEDNFCNPVDHSAADGTAQGTCVCECQCVKKDGTIFHALCSHAWGKNTGDMYESEIIHDNTQQKVTENTLREARKDLEKKVNERTAEIRAANMQLKMEIKKHKAAEQKIQQLNKQLVVAQESERNKIASDLHDSVAQDLATMKISVEEYFCSNKQLPEEIQKRGRVLSRLITDCMAGIRNMSYDLRSPVLNEFGLAESLHRFCKEFAQRSGVDLDYSAAGMENISFGFENDINVFRIVQETLNNIFKHAGAQKVMVRLVAVYPQVIIRVRDNGRGFDVDAALKEAPERKCMGLQNMYERARFIGADIRITSSQKSGTEVRLMIPCEGS